MTREYHFYILVTLSFDFSAAHDFKKKNKYVSLERNVQVHEKCYHIKVISK